MTDSSSRKTWRKPTFYAALVLLGGATLIGAVVGVSALSGVEWRFLAATPSSGTARDVELQPYALPPRQQVSPDIPNSPARRQSYVGGPVKPGDALRSQRGFDDVEPPPTTLASGEFVAAVESGRKVFLPNPKGKCDVAGTPGSMPQAIDDCFAGRLGGR